MRNGIVEYVPPAEGMTLRRSRCGIVSRIECTIGLGRHLMNEHWRGFVVVVCGSVFFYWGGGGVHMYIPYLRFVVWQIRSLCFFGGGDRERPVRDVFGFSD